MLDGAVCLVQPTRFPEASRVDIYEYGLALANQGVETHVIVSEDCSRGLPARLRVHALGFPPVNTPSAWWRFAREAQARLRALGRQTTLRIVHLFNPSPATYLLGRLLKRDRRPPWIVYDLRTGGLGHGPAAWLTDAMARNAAGFADQVVALSAALGTRLLGAPGRFRTVPLGVNLGSFQPGARAARPDGEFRFVYCGTLSPNRRLENMLRAFELVRSHAQARLVIAGDGADRRRLEGFVAARAMQHAVRFLGKRPFDEIPAILADCDCGLAYLPDAPWFAPQPQLKTLEYFAMNLPAVAVRTAGNREIWNGLPGELLTADDPASFAAGMRYALERRGQLAGLGFRGIAARFSWQAIVRDTLLPLYAELAARR